MKRVALYARVSTTGHGQDPEVQLRDLRQHLQRQGWEGAGEYVDTGFSGAKAQRPALDQLMVDAADRKFDAVLVWKFDRFARSTIHLAQALDTFKKLNVSFISLTEQIDTSTPSGKLVFTILGACAEMEREIIAERVKAGLRHAAAEGRHAGRPRTIQLTPADVRRTVVQSGGSVARASQVLGISYGYTYLLNKKAGGKL